MNACRFALPLVACLMAACANNEPASDALSVTDARLDSPITDTGPSADTLAAPDLDPKLRAQLFDEVQAYLTAEDAGASPPLLAKLDKEYKGVAFAVLAAAVRHRPKPAKLPHTGAKQLNWTNPHTKGFATYHAYVPAALATAGKDRYPLLVFLHGAGGNGADLVNNKVWQGAADTLGVIFVAPTSHKSCDWSYHEDCMSQVVMLVQHLKRRYPVDDDRVVLSGFSMGGRGSFSVGVAYPDPYCGVVPVAGTIGAVQNTSDLGVHQKYCCPHVENALNLRLHYISGDQDVPLLVYQNRGCELCLKSMKNEYVYTELPGVGHVMPMGTWSKAVAWTLAKPRAPYPATVIYNQAYQDSSQYPTGMWAQTKLKLPQYWADMDARADTAMAARLQATVSKNTITLTTVNVSKATVYLADGLLDLSAAVTITDGAKVLHSGKVQRDRRFLLTEARRRGERSMIFANRVVVSF